MESVRQFGGVNFPQLEFRDGKKKITYEQPRGWGWSQQTARKIVFSHPSATEANFVIESMSLASPLKLEEETIRQIKQQAPAWLPPGAEQIALVAEDRDALRLGGHAVYELVASFVLTGQKFKTDLLFLNLDDCQIRFKLCCREDDFPTLHKLFWRSLYSWQWL